MGWSAKVSRTRGPSRTRASAPLSMYFTSDAGAVQHSNACFASLGRFFLVWLRHSNSARRPRIARDLRHRYGHATLIFGEGKLQRGADGGDRYLAALRRESSVGGGTGMVCYEFKRGIGTSSRKLTDAAGGYTVGVLVQCNCGRRLQLMIAGVPVGKS